MTDPYQRVFRILREAVATTNGDDDKHRAMTMRALIELSVALTEGAQA